MASSPSHRPHTRGSGRTKEVEEEKIAPIIPISSPILTLPVPITTTVPTVPVATTNPRDEFSPDVHHLQETEKAKTRAEQGGKPAGAEGTQSNRNVGVVESEQEKNRSSRTRTPTPTRGQQREQHGNTHPQTTQQGQRQGQSQEQKQGEETESHTGNVMEGEEESRGEEVIEGLRHRVGTLYQGGTRVVHDIEKKVQEMGLPTDVSEAKSTVSHFVCGMKRKLKEFMGKLASQNQQRKVWMATQFLVNWLVPLYYHNQPGAWASIAAYLLSSASQFLIYSAKGWTRLLSAGHWPYLLLLPYLVWMSGGTHAEIPHIKRIVTEIEFPSDRGGYAQIYIPAASGGESEAFQVWKTVSVIVNTALLLLDAANLWFYWKKGDTHPLPQLDYDSSQHSTRSPSSSIEQYHSVHYSPAPHDPHSEGHTQSAHR